MTDERDQQSSEAPEPERDGTGFRKDGVMEYGIDKEGFLTIEGEQLDKVTDDPGGALEKFSIGDRQYTQGEIESAFQRAEEADTKISEAEKMKEALDPYLHVVQDPRFTDYLQERVDEGEMDPPRYPASSPEDLAGHTLRMEKPGSVDVLDAMLRHAESDSCPDHEKEALQNNPKYFCTVFDRIHAALGDTTNRPSVADLQKQQIAAETPDSVFKQILKSKEVSKDRAAVERPGVGSPEVSDNQGRREWAKVKAYAVQGDEESQMAWADAIITSSKRTPPTKKTGF